ncbi:MAG: YecA family protein [Burkholderiales bacterium]
MQLSDFEPLDNDELQKVDDVLMKHGNDDAIQNASELDGFFTALASGPVMVMPSQWTPAIWGGTDREPKWSTPKQAERFYNLLMRHLNSIAAELMESPETFEPVFLENRESGNLEVIVDEWCIGYMRGVALCGGWHDLPAEQAGNLDAIALHGVKENFERVEAMTEEELQASITAIEPAVRELHAYYLIQRTPQTVRTREERVGRNDPCPCGSGKKFKQCCLH